MCPRARAPAPAGAPSASSPGPRAAFQLRLLRITPFPVLPRTPGPLPLPLPRATSKKVQCNSRAGKKELESLLSPKSAIPRPSRTPERHPHLPTTFHAQTICSPPAIAKSGTAPGQPLPLGQVRSPPPAARPAGARRTRGASAPRCLGARGLAYLAWCGRSRAPRSHEAAPSPNPGEPQNPAQHERGGRRAKSCSAEETIPSGGRRGRRVTLAAAAAAAAREQF